MVLILRSAENVKKSILEQKLGKKIKYHEK